MPALYCIVLGLALLAQAQAPTYPGTPVATTSAKSEPKTNGPRERPVSPPTPVNCVLQPDRCKPPAPEASSMSGKARPKPKPGAEKPVNPVGPVNCVGVPKCKPGPDASGDGKTTPAPESAAQKARAAKSKGRE